MTSARRGRKTPTPLTNAVLTGEIANVEAALAADAKVEERDGDARTPLHHACIDGRSNIVDRLLQLGADPSAVDSAGWTPLHFAAQAHHVKIASSLIRSGARVDATDSQGNTPLFRAVFESRGRGEMIELLLASGADRHRANAHRTSPLKLAKTIANFDVKKWFR